MEEVNEKIFAKAFSFTLCFLCIELRINYDS